MARGGGGCQGHFQRMVHVNIRHTLEINRGTVLLQNENESAMLLFGGKRGKKRRSAVVWVFGGGVSWRING